MFQYKSSLLFILTLFILSTSQVSGEVINKVAAIVNDTIITTYDLDQKTAEAAAMNPEFSSFDTAEQLAFKKQILDRMIEDELIQQRAEELKISATDEEINAAIDDVQQQNKLTRLQLITALEQQGMSFDVYLSNMKNQITRYKLIAQEVQNKVDVTNQGVRSYYDQHSADYRDDPYVHLSRLTFPLSAEASQGEIDAAQTQAKKARKRLLKGDSVADLLMTYSDATGGDMGKLKESNLVEDFSKAITGLKTGEISEIVSTPTGLFIFKMVERNSGTAKPLEAVRPEIEKILLEKSKEESLKKWQKDLRTNAYIDIRI
jgi:peptidyl-prolyl cis-trans isomerase SurA